MVERRGQTPPANSVDFSNTNFAAHLPMHSNVRCLQSAFSGLRYLPLWICTASKRLPNLSNKQVATEMQPGVELGRVHRDELSACKKYGAPFWPPNIRACSEAWLVALKSRKTWERKMQLPSSAVVEILSLKGSDVFAQLLLTEIEPDTALLARPKGGLSRQHQCSHTSVKI